MYKKRVLMLPDIPGWVMESIADGIISALKGKFNFTKEFADPSDHGGKVVDWNDIDNYDVIYLMLSGYLPNLESYSSIATSYHGGPGSESQANILQRKGLQGMAMSFVSHQTKERIDSPFIGRQKINLDMKVRGMIKKLGLRENDTLRFIPFNRLQTKVEFTKKGFGFDNLHFTPYGVNVNFFNQEKIRSDFVCGYAGWIQYLMGSQKDHRRGHWIMEAQDELKFHLNIAGGLENIGGSVNKIKNFQEMYNGKNVRAGLYNREKMVKFYKSISCYLVPDKFAGGPMPVLEAGAMGIPVITTDCGHCGDFIKHEVHGLVVKTYDEFLESIYFMKKHPEAREEMGKNLQKYIREKRTWKAVSPHWEKFFHAV